MSDPKKFKEDERVWYVDFDEAILHEGHVVSETDVCLECRQLLPTRTWEKIGGETYIRIHQDGDKEGKTQLIPIEYVYKRKNAAVKKLIEASKVALGKVERNLSSIQRDIKRLKEKESTLRLAVEVLEDEQSQRPDIPLPFGWKLVSRIEPGDREKGCNFEADRRVIIQKGNKNLEVREGFSESGGAWDDSIYYEVEVRLLEWQSKGKRKRRYGGGIVEDWDYIIDSLYEGGKTSRKRLEEHWDKIKEFFEEPDLSVDHLDLMRTLIIPTAEELAEMPKPMNLADEVEEDSGAFEATDLDTIEL